MEGLLREHGSTWRLPFGRRLVEARKQQHVLEAVEVGDETAYLCLRGVACETSSPTGIRHTPKRIEAK